MRPLYLACYAVGLRKTRRKGLRKGPPGLAGSAGHAYASAASNRTHHGRRTPKHAPNGPRNARYRPGLRGIAPYYGPFATRATPQLPRTRRTRVGRRSTQTGAPRAARAPRRPKHVLERGAAVRPRRGASGHAAGRPATRALRLVRGVARPPGERRRLDLSAESEIGRGASAAARGGTRPATPQGVRPRVRRAVAAKRRPPRTIPGSRSTDCRLFAQQRPDGGT